MNADPAHAENPADWHFYLASGLGNATYDNATQQRIELQMQRGGSSPAVGFFDLPAVYREMSYGLGLGGVFNIGLKHVARAYGERDSFAIQSFNPAASLIWFMDGDFGQGWFLRTDLGWSRILQISESPVVGGALYQFNNYDALFAQAAVGYGITVGKSLHLLSHLNLFQATGGSRWIQGFNINVGFLF
jgi:hypothetical protein